MPGLQAQELPVPSPYAEVMQRIGLTDVKIMYSRPGVKDRTIFGELEAYDEVWRTGANAATKIELSTDATIGGKEVKAGTYSLFTIPGKEQWKVMLNSDTQASEGSYKAENNVAEIEVKASSSDMNETMLFYFENVKNDQAELVFEWEKVKWMVPIKVEVEEMAEKNIREKMDEIEKNYRAYNSSARYYYDNDKDLEQALKWAQKSVEIEERFWNVYTLSLIQAKMGKKKEAIATAKKSMELAEKDNYQPYVKMNKENIEKWSK